MTKPLIITEDQLDLMHIIECDSNASQRHIAKKTGLSTGKVNYCLKALIDIGFIKIHNFSKSNQKIKIGQDALIKKGTLKGIMVKICSLPSKQRVDILLNCLGSLRRVTLPTNHLKF